MQLPVGNRSLVGCTKGRLVRHWGIGVKLNQREVTEDHPHDAFAHVRVIDRRRRLNGVAGAERALEIAVFVDHHRRVGAAAEGIAFGGEADSEAFELLVGDGQLARPHDGGAFFGRGCGSLGVDSVVTLFFGGRFCGGFRRGVGWCNIGGHGRQAGTGRQHK